MQTSPLAIFLFSKLKSMPKGRRFDIIDDIEKIYQKVSQDILNEALKYCLEK